MSGSVETSMRMPGYRRRRFPAYPTNPPETRSPETRRDIVAPNPESERGVAQPPANSRLTTPATLTRTHGRRHPCGEGKTNSGHWKGTPPYSLLTTHYSLFTTHYSLPPFLQLQDLQG